MYCLISYNFVLPNNNLIFNLYLSLFLSKYRENIKKISAKLISEEKVSEELAINSAKEGFEEVERLLANHSEAV